jgi:hypothetical protein
MSAINVSILHSMLNVCRIIARSHFKLLLSFDAIMKFSSGNSSCSSRWYVLNSNSSLLLLYSKVNKNDLIVYSIIEALKLHSLFGDNYLLLCLKTKFNHYVIFPCLCSIFLVFVFVFLIVFNEVVLRPNTSIFHVSLHFDSLAPNSLIIFTIFPNVLLQLDAICLSIEDWFSWNEVLIWIWFKLLKEETFRIILDTANGTKIFIYFSWNLIG